jgi:glycyl-tRNA synthetase beta chain
MDAALFTCREEKALYDSYITVKKAVAEYKYDYAGVIDELTKLTAPIDMFFDKVMVMDKDEVIKNNRLGLLKNIDNLVKKTADFSRIVL